MRQGKRNPNTLLVGIQISITIMENSTEFQKLELPYEPAIPQLGICPKEIK